jgi:hypothetical protein
MKFSVVEPDPELFGQVGSKSVLFAIKNLFILSIYIIYLVDYRYVTVHETYFPKKILKML